MGESVLYGDGTSPVERLRCDCRQPAGPLLAVRRGRSIYVKFRDRHFIVSEGVLTLTCPYCGKSHTLRAGQTPSASN